MKTNPCDVTGVTAGGLVGSSSAAIRDSYSTCSVDGSTAGGFAGSAGGSIVNCYATGLVKGTAKFAFLADGDAELSGNYYYSQINEAPSTGEGETEPMPPVNGYTLTAASLGKVRPLDLNAEAYNDFAGSWSQWSPARAFDSALVRYYSGKYALRTVDRLTAGLPPGYDDWNALFAVTHYGDWPSPEVFFINTDGG